MPCRLSREQIKTLSVVEIAKEPEQNFCHAQIVKERSQKGLLCRLLCRLSRDARDSPVLWRVKGRYPKILCPSDCKEKVKGSRQVCCSDCQGMSKTFFVAQTMKGRSHKYFCRVDWQEKMTKTSSCVNSLEIIRD